MVDAQSFMYRARKDFRKNRSLYLLVLPVILFYVIFSYKPMYGAIIAFKDYSPALGAFDSPWVGLDHFIRFFNSPYFFRLLRNTFLLSFYSLVFGFPAPVILALLLNEVKNKAFRRITQTITYLPHFISLIVVAGMIVDFTMSTGVINNIIVFFGGKSSPLLQNPDLYRSIYIISGIWQEAGWGTIIYLAALSGIDEQLYEAAMMDGAGKIRQLINITLPGLLPTIIILLILRMGSLLNIGYEKTILLYNPATYETADIIPSYVYRVGILETNWSYSTAVGLFNSVINFILLLAANKLSKRFGETSLW